MRIFRQTKWLWLTVVIVGLALCYFRFVSRDVALAEWVLWHLAYGFTWLIWISLAFLVVPVLRHVDFSRRDIIGIGGMGVAYFLVQINEPHFLKVYSDEQTHAAVAWMMHYDRMFAMPVSMHFQVGGVPQIDACVSSFRSHGFSQFVSVFMDFGLSSSMACYVANGLLGAFVPMLFYVVMRYCGVGGMAAMVPGLFLLATPIYGQVVCSGAYDLFNLCVLQVLVVSLLAYSLKRTECLSWLVLLFAVLLSYARVESMLYSALAVAYVFWLNRARLHFLHVVYPLLYLPSLATQVIMLSDRDTYLVQGQIKPGQSYWSLGNLVENLQDSLVHFLGGSAYRMGNGLLFILGLLAFAYLVSLRRAGRLGEPLLRNLMLILLVMTPLVLGLYMMVMGGFWGGPCSTPIMTRFTLPIWLLLALFIATWLIFERRTWLIVTVFLVSVGAFLMNGLGAYTKSQSIDAMHFGWGDHELMLMAKRHVGPRDLVVHGKPFTMIRENICSVGEVVFRARAAHYAEMTRLNMFSRVILANYELVMDGAANGKIYTNREWGGFCSKCVLKELESRYVNVGFKITLYELVSYTDTKGVVHNFSPKCGDYPKYGESPELMIELRRKYLGGATAK